MPSRNIAGLRAMRSIFGLAIVAGVLFVVACGKESAPSPQATLTIADISPSTGARLTGNSVLVTCTTSLNAVCTATLRRADADKADAKQIVGVPGTAHRIELSGLDAGADYILTLTAAAGGQSVTAGEIRFSVARLQALVFVDHEPKFSILRDYNQRAAVQVKNIDNRPHGVRLAVVDEPADLVLGFLGPGSEDDATPLVLQPGEIRECRLMIYAPNAKNHAYKFHVALRDLETPGGKSFFDEAQVDLAVQFPKFDIAVALDETRRDPQTLALPVTITNNGETITDLTVELEPKLKSVLTTPSYSSYILSEHKTIETILTPGLFPGFAGASGDLIVRGAGAEKHIPVEFKTPPGQRAYLAFGDPVNSCPNAGTSSTPGPTDTGGGGVPPRGPGGGGGGDGPPKKPDDKDFGFSTHHRITRPALLALLPRLGEDISLAPARCVAPPVVYTAWHAPASGGSNPQIFTSIQPRPAKVMQVTADNARNLWPDIAIDDAGEVLITWERHRAGAPTEIMFIRGTVQDYNIRFGTPEVLATGKSLQNPVVVRVQTGAGSADKLGHDCIVAWQDANTFAFARSNAAGKWQPLTTVSPPPGHRVWWHQVVATTDGNTLLFYAREDPAGKKQIICQHSGDGGNSWGQPRGVSALGDVGEPCAMLAPGSIRAVWLAWRETGRIMGSRSDDGGVSWPAPAALTDKLEVAEQPLLWVDALDRVSLTFLTRQNNQLQVVSQTLHETYARGPVEPPNDYSSDEAVLARESVSLDQVRGLVRPGFLDGQSGHLGDIATYSFAQPTLYKDGKSTHFLWLDARTGNGRIFYAAIGPDSKFKVRPTAINPIKISGNWPTMAVAGNKVAVAYVDLDGRVMLQQSSDGQSLTPPTTLGAGHAFAPSIALNSKGDPAVGWVDDKNDLCLCTDGKTVTLLPSSNAKRQPPTLVFDKTGRLYCAFARSAGGINIMSTGDGVKWEPPQTISETGNSPSLATLADGAVYLAFSRTTNEIAVTHGTAAGWSPLEIAAKNADYAENPSLVDSADGPTIAYHAPSKNGRVTRDTLFLTTRGKTEWGESCRILCLAENINGSYLTVSFALMHERPVYRPFETNVLINGHLLGTIENMIPEGRFIFPVNPAWLHYVPYGASENTYTLVTDRLNRAHFYMVYDYTLTTDYLYNQRYIFATSQAEADAKLRAAEPTYNHDQSDIGIYANTIGDVPASPQDAQEIVLKVYAFNRGPKRAEGVRVQAFAKEPTMRDGAYTGETLSDLVDVGSVEPFEGRTVELRIRGRKGLDRFFTAAWSSDKDFDLSNNVQGITFDVPPEQSPFAGLRMGDLSPRGQVKIDVSVGKTKPAWRDVSVSFFPAGNHLQEADAGGSEGSYSVRPITYDVKVTYLKSLSPVEVWIPGVKVEADMVATVKADLPVGTIDFGFAPVLGEMADVQIYPAGTRGASLHWILTADAPTHAVDLPAGRYDLHLNLRGAIVGAPPVETSAEVRTGEHVTIPVPLVAGGLAVAVPFPADKENAFDYFVNVYESPAATISTRPAEPTTPAAPATVPAKTGRCVVAGARGSTLVYLPQGRYDILVTHPFPRGDPLNIEKWLPNVDITQGQTTTVNAELPVTRLHVRPQSPRGPIVHSTGYLYPPEDHSRPVYVFSTDMDITVATRRYDLFVPLGDRNNWLRNIDPAAGAITPRANNGAIVCDINVEPDVPAEVYGELLRIPTIALQEGRYDPGTLTERLSSFDVRRWSVATGESDLRLRLNGYGPDASHVYSKLRVTPGADATASDTVKLGALRAVAPGDTGNLSEEVLLYPAGDRVKRILDRATNDPFRLNQEIPVVPGHYDMVVRYPALGEGVEETLPNLFVANLEIRDGTLLPRASLKAAFTGGGNILHRTGVGVVADRVGKKQIAATQDRLLSLPKLVAGLPPGFYDLTPALNGILVPAARKSAVELVAGRETEFAASIPAGEVLVTLHLPDGSAPEGAGNVWLTALSEGLSGTTVLKPAGSGKFTTVVPAGEYHVIADLGARAWSAPLKVTADRAVALDILVTTGSLAVQAARSTGAPVSHSVDIFPPGISDTPLATTIGSAPVTLAAGLYDVRATLDTGEVQWQRNVKLDAGRHLILRQEFPAPNLIATAKDPTFNRRELGFLVLVFQAGTETNVGHFYLGDPGAHLPPGNYDLLLAASEKSRNGIRKANIKIADTPAQVTFDETPAMIGLDSYPLLNDASGNPAIPTIVRRAGSSDIIATGLVGVPLVVPAGKYEIEVAYNGPYGKINKTLALAAEPGLCTGGTLFLGDKLGTARIRNASPYTLLGPGVPKEIAVLQSGKLLATYRDQIMMPLPIGRSSLTVSPNTAVQAPQRLAETDALTDFELPADLIAPVGGLIYPADETPARIRIALPNHRDQILLETWTNHLFTAPAGVYDLWTEKSGWIGNITVEGSRVTVVKH